MAMNNAVKPPTKKVKAYDKDGNYLGEMEQEFAPAAPEEFGVVSQFMPKAEFGKKMKPTSDVAKDESKSNSTVESLIKTASSAGSAKKRSLNSDTSIVDYLKSSGKSSDFNSRKSLAETFDLGDGEYKGTAKQNTKLLSLLKSKKSKEVPAQDEIDEKGMLKQNGSDVTPQDMQDGTWDDYLEWAQSQGDSAPSFSAYKRKLSKGLI